MDKSDRQKRKEYPRTLEGHNLSADISNSIMKKKDKTRSIFSLKVHVHECYQFFFFAWMKHFHISVESSTEVELELHPT